jgi:hypothetical protein
MLYSINEQNATVALQNVRSRNRRREITEPGLSFVAPAPDAVHPYLLFLGQDIKDLHVHEAVVAAAAVKSGGGCRCKVSIHTSAYQIISRTFRKSSNTSSTATSGCICKDCNLNRNAPSPLQLQRTRLPGNAVGIIRNRPPKRGGGRVNEVIPRKTQVEVTGPLQDDREARDQKRCGYRRQLVETHRGASTEAHRKQTPKNDFDFQSTCKN